MLSSSDWLAIGTFVLAIATVSSVMLFWYESDKNRRLAALERRNNNFYSPLFLLLQSISYNAENKDKLQTRLLDLCLSNVVNVGAGINNAVTDYLDGMAKLPVISHEALNAIAVNRTAEVPIPSEVQEEISNARASTSALFRKFLKEIAENGQLEYKLIISEVSKINREKYVEPTFSFIALNELMEKL